MVELEFRRQLAGADQLVPIAYWNETSYVGEVHDARPYWVGFPPLTYPLLPADIRYLVPRADRSITILKAHDG